MGYIVILLSIICCTFVTLFIKFSPSIIIVKDDPNFILILLFYTIKSKENSYKIRDYITLLKIKK